MNSNKMLLAFAACWSLSLVGPLGLTAVAQSPKVQVVMTRLFCEHTTEAGHDEVYCYYGGVNGAGQQKSDRKPGLRDGAGADNGTAWDMNDRGDKQDQTFNATLYEEPLAPGQSARLGFVFRESDGSDIRDAFRDAGMLAGKVAEVVDDPEIGAIVKVVAAVFKLLGALVPKNNDDPLGAFALKLTNQNGNLLIETAAGEYTTVQEPLNNQVGTFAYHFDHDDGRYQAYFKVRLLQFDHPKVSTPQEPKWYHIQSEISGLFLDVRNYDIRDNADICQALKDNKQAWQLVPGAHPGCYNILFKTGSEFRNLDVYLGQPVEAGRICLAAVHEGQEWKLIPDRDGWFRIQSCKTGYFLDVFQGAQQVGARICQTRGANAEQVWRFDPAD
jgi:hypothetical protein